MTLASLQIEKEDRGLLKEFGYSEREFIVEAVRDKLRELKRLQFFVISEKVRRGLRKKGIKPEDVLKEILS